MSKSAYEAKNLKHLPGLLSNKNTQVIERGGVWVVTTNTDLTEGRGSNYRLLVTDSEASARLAAKGQGIMGTDAEVKWEECWLTREGPYAIFGNFFPVTPKSKEDLEYETLMAKLSPREKELLQKRLKGAK